METVLQAISTVGFPIVISIILIYFIKDETAKHKEETDGLRSAIQALEIAITRLVDKVAGGENG